MRVNCLFRAVPHGVLLIAYCVGAPAVAVDTMSGSTTLNLTSPISSAAANAVVMPAFHVAPMLLEQPDDLDTVVPDVSAQMRPHVASVPALLGKFSTRRLTPETIRDALAGRVHPDLSELHATPLGSGTAVATYTPAQIRAAYDWSALPALSGLSAAQAALLGAGQTIYLIDAMNDPNVSAELAAFDEKFGLPGCTVTYLATNASLPLAAASATSCVLDIAYSTTTGKLTSSAPASDSGWATEIAIDVQWAHATAPLARLVLIEAPDASANTLVNAVNLANAMGPGAVSMSFGTPEGSYVASLDSSFSLTNMTYLAAVGDSGAGVNWPAVSAHVLAVGGTSLTFTGAGPRSEVAWSNTGGGISQYVATPSYQKGAVPNIGTLSHRTVSDVSFNANPSTGQYLATIASGTTTVNWLSAGGTSLSTPQWAGIIAVANAMRAESAKSVLGAPQTMLYQSIAAASTSTYSSAFGDVTRGSDGTCGACTAHAGYDAPTGLGTPNISTLLSLLSASPAATSSPVVNGAAVSGTAGTPVSFTATATAPDAVTFSLTSGPNGMSVSAAGVATWAAPVAGSYAVIITAMDSKTGLSGRGTFTLTIAPAPIVGPVITVSPASGTVGHPFSVTIQLADATSSSVTFNISGVPSGLTFKASGLTVTGTWPKPVTGNYSLTILATDHAGYSAHAVLPISIKAK